MNTKRYISKTGKTWRAVDKAALVATIAPHFPGLTITNFLGAKDENGTDIILLAQEGGATETRTARERSVKPEQPVAGTVRPVAATDSQVERLARLVQEGALALDGIAAGLRPAVAALLAPPPVAPAPAPEPTGPKTDRAALAALVAETVEAVLAAREAARAAKMREAKAAKAAAA